MAKVKTHFVFPEKLLKDIDRIVGDRKRSQFVVEATREKLEREQLKKTFKDAKGIWKEEDYPEFKVMENIEEWVSDLRKRDLKRRKRDRGG